MITKDDLIPFCNRDRAGLEKPWSLGKYTIAANGTTLIRVPRLRDVKEDSGAPQKVSHLFSEVTPKAIYADMPELPPIQRDGCDSCGGTGEHSCSCHRCNYQGPCEDCHGTGGETEVQTDVIIGTRKMDARLLRLLLPLPGLLVQFNGDKHSPMHFKFNGGDGLVMPLGDPTSIPVKR
jgi:hypothetical protein